jgi:hypothetical protein
VAIIKSMFLHMRKGNIPSAFAFPSPELVGFDHVFAVGTDPWPGGPLQRWCNHTSALRGLYSPPSNPGGDLKRFGIFPYV